MSRGTPVRRKQGAPGRPLTEVAYGEHAEPRSDAGVHPLLTLYVWNNDTKSKLILGSSRFGHVALLVPGDANHKALYISWWPQEDDRIGISTTGISLIDKRVGAYTVTAVRDRGFGDDIWAEQNCMLASMSVCTLDRRVLKLLEGTSGPMLTKSAIQRVTDQIADEIAMATRGAVQLGRFIIGTNEEDDWFLLEDLENNASYILIDSKRLKGVKVLKLTGKTTLGSTKSSSKYLGLLPKNVTDPSVKQTLGFISKDILGKDIFRDDALTVTRLSAALWKIDGKWKSYLLRNDAETSTLSLIECQRSQLAPDELIQIPTKSDGVSWGLDASAIRTWWAFVNRADSPQWSTLDQNCSVIVMSALKVGGAAGLYQPPDKVFLCWTPADVASYVKTLNERIKTGGLNVKKLDENGVIQRSIIQMSKRTRKQNREHDPLASNIPLGVDYATSTVVWSRSVFASASGSLVGEGRRTHELRKIDDALDAYHLLPKKKDTKCFTDRAGGLGRVMDAIAELLLKMRNIKVSSAGNAAVVQLADRVYTERQELLKLAVEAKKGLVTTVSVTGSTTTSGTTAVTPTQRSRRRLAQLPPRPSSGGSGS